jgi:hypothetical protein
MCVEIMTGTAWVNVSDNMNVVESPTQSRTLGHAFVFGEAAPLVTSGKLEPVEVTVRGIWAEGTADPFYSVYAQHTTNCGGLVAVRWTPDGCTGTANDTFYTSTTVSQLVSLQFPTGAADSGDPIMYQFTVRSPDITRALWS